MRRYGASPAHLLAHLALLPLAGWAVLQVLDIGNPGRVLLWLAAAAVLHDFAVVPFASLLDHASRRGLPGPAVNHVRVPAALAILLGAVFLAQIAGRSDAAYRHVSGRSFEGSLARWLLATAALFAISGAVYLVRSAASGSRA